MQKEQFDITGMTCSACSARIETDAENPKLEEALKLLEKMAR